MADTEVDLISFLPPNIIGRILNKVPIKDLVRTSLLSREWRYKWATVCDLNINFESCIEDSDLSLHPIGIFITNYLFLHEGGFQRFLVRCINYLGNPKLLDQWLLFLWKKGIKELCIGLIQPEWYNVPSYLFNCVELTRLELYRCRIGNPLPSFEGFLCLKFLKLYEVIASNYSRLISNCPLLETLMIVKPRGHQFDLTLCAPNLKDLTLIGDFKDIYFENTPMLIKATLFIDNIDDEVQHTRCNFDRFMEGVPRLEKLYGSFTKYLSKDIKKTNVDTSMHQLNHLKFVKLKICIDDIDQVRFLFRFLKVTPNIERLRIKEIFNNPPSNLQRRPRRHRPRRNRPRPGSQYPSTEISEIIKEECWEEIKYSFEKLKIVDIRGLFQLDVENKLVQLIFERATQLQKFFIQWNEYFCKESKRDVLVKLLEYRRASTLARALVTL